MDTIPHQTSRSDMIETEQDNDRRQQTDRRRESGRREADQQHPEQSFQLDRIKNAQTEEHFGNDSRNRETTLKSRPVVHALSEDEIRFLLDDD